MPGRFCCRFSRYVFRHSEDQLEKTYLQLDHSLKNSKNVVLPVMESNAEFVVRLKCKKKKNEEIEEFLAQHFNFYNIMKCYFHIKYQQNALLGLIKEHSSRKFECSNSEHLEKFRGIWETFFEEPCPPIPSSEWKLLGYQGNDPSSDFRGYALLCLDAFYYACCVVDYEHSNTWDLLSENPMRLAFFKTSHYPLFLFAIQFIKAIDITHNMLLNDILVNTIFRKTSKSSVTINSFYYFVKKTFIYYSTIYPTIYSPDVSDKELNDTAIKLINDRLKSDPNFY
ncbi:ELMO domain-containing protein 1 [Thelohanellus kitauei]|uniref:ELMO domain-containing protein 1 n=1 Tax=Thelohanellus kitauei TaxID=669202 RepID=A0A0C2N4A1_THEKT|nr:ELMO domain-containing protein 1 [Thelohanellus kitauei]